MIKHVELSDVLDVFYKLRAVGGGGLGATASAVDAALVELTLEAARAVDPDEKASG